MPPRRPRTLGPRAMDLFQDWTIASTYVLCSAVGGVILTLQLILMMFGGDADFDGDLEIDDGMGLLSVRSVASFLTFFGLVGLWGHQRDWTPAASAGAGLLAGLAMMVLVAWVMVQYRKLDSSGNVDPDGAVGGTAVVYLTVPGEGSGRGKITVSLQGRTHEFQATTTGPALATGAEVRVLRRVSSDTFEVGGLDA